MNCEYCDKVFQNKYTLKRHHKQGICQKIRNGILLLESKSAENDSLKNELVEMTIQIDILKQQHDDEVDELEYKLATKEDRIDELVNEVERLKMEVVEAKAENQFLQKTNQFLLEKSGNTTNNNTTIYQVLVTMTLTVVKLDEIFEMYYTRQDLKGGQVGLARFVARYVVITKGGKKMYAISDFNRGTGTFIDPVNGVTKDFKCLTLTKMVSGPCLRRADQIVKDEDILIDTTPGGNGDIWINMESRGYKQLAFMENDNKSFLEELVRQVIHV